MNFRRFLIIVLVVVCLAAIIEFTPSLFRANHGVLVSVSTPSIPSPTPTITVPPTATQPPTPTPLPNSFSDSLTNGNINGWSMKNACSFESDGLHINGTGQTNTQNCYAPFRAVNNADISVTVAQINGPTNQDYGIGFRSTSRTGSTFCFCYGFRITNNGYWDFDKTVGVSTFQFIVPYTISSAIHTGLNAVNTMEVRFTGSSFTFYINGVNVGAVNDTSFSADTTSIFAYRVDAIFTNFTIST